MMERRKALTLPFTVNQENLMENPLKIPIICLTSECGKLERQVPWAAIAGCKLKQNDSQVKNGSMHNHAATVILDMARRKPCLILEDVLKTEKGKAYMERIKQSHYLGNGGQVTSARRETGQCREEPLICRDTQSSQREAKNDKKSVTPKHNQKTTSSPSSRQRLRRRLQNPDDEDDKEENGDNEIAGEDRETDFTEVVDCGLLLSLEHAKDSSSCDELSPASIKDRCSEKEVQHCLKRKGKDEGSQCNGTGSPKRHRKSVLRLTGEDGRDEGAGPARVHLEDSGEDGDLENLDRSIVQFTVGRDDRTKVLVPIVSPNLETGDVVGTPRRRLSSSQDSTSKTSPSEPIVLSSDDEENQPCSPAVHTLVTVGDMVIQGQTSQEAAAKQHEVSDMQVLRVVVDDRPGSVALPSRIEYSCMCTAFCTLHCGGYQGKANGDIMMADHKIIIPLKDSSDEEEVMLTIERKELRRYSVWDQEEMEAHELQFKSDEPSPAAVLLFCVSETAAAAIQRDLSKLCVKQGGTTNTGKASPFVLLTLRNPLGGMEGALFRSLLDIDCLNSLTHGQSIVAHDPHKPSGWEDMNAPVLSLDESIELIKRNGLDPHLLSLLGMEMSDPELNTDQDGSHSDTHKNPSARISLEVEPHKETVLELETAPVQDTGTQLSSDEDQKEQEPEPPAELKNEEPTNLYTLCHRRTKGSYSVSLCKPAFNWTKYKHQGLARRLIQFPPPPLKGGITVTMEDLQCLDSGHFLNDVIIDFYLKYLIQNASAAVAQRSHIFSSFFYKQLTRRDNASEGTNSDSCQRQRRHQRVKTWTRHVDIFEKDFLFVPVNQEAHWYLVVICFPGLDEPKVEAWTGPDSQAAKCHNRTGEVQGNKSPNSNTETGPGLNHSDSMETDTEDAQDESTKDPPPGPVNCTEQTCQKNAICKRPCILIMDSLKLSLHERVFKLLREYLQSEWEARRCSSRDFGPEQMKSSHCEVPLQDNSSDCGLYLLQYVENFLKDPVVHFDLPLHLERWFPRQQVRRKRDEIRDLVLNLYRHQNLDNNR